jgi:hypothetical protein
MSTVLASVFYDKIGNHDNNLYDGGYYYAELSGRLGNLPNNHPLRITYNGKTVTAYKGDVGRGGPRNPAIDLHIKLANALGFPSNGLDYVTIG